MYILLINNKPVPTANDTILPFIVRGGFSFLENSSKDAIEHFELPITPALNEALEYNLRLNAYDRNKEYSLIVQKNGTVIFEGKCRISSWTISTVKLFAAGGKPLIRRDFRKKYIHEYWYHDPIEFPNYATFIDHIVNLFTQNQSPDSWYTLFPVYVPSIASSSIGVEGGGRLFGQNNFTVYEQTGVFPAQFPTSFVINRFISVFYRLHKVVRHILEAEGFKIGENWLENYENKKITIYNNYDLTSQYKFSDINHPKYIEPKRCMPLLTVDELINGIEKEFNITFDFDRSYFGEVNIISNDEQLQKPAQINLDKYVAKPYERKIVNGYTFAHQLPEGNSSLVIGEITDEDGPFIRAEPEWPNSNSTLPAHENLIVCKRTDVWEESAKNSLYTYTYHKYKYQIQNLSQVLVLEDLNSGNPTDEIGSIKREGENALNYISTVGIPTMHMAKFFVDYVGMEDHIEFNYFYMPKMDVKIQNRNLAEFQDPGDQIGLWLIKENGVRSTHWFDAYWFHSYTVTMNSGTTSHSGPLAHFFNGYLPVGYTPELYPSPKYCLRWFNDEQEIGSGMFARNFKKTAEIYTNSVRETVRGNIPAEVLANLSRIEPVRYNDANWIVEEVRLVIKPNTGKELTEIDLIKV